MNGQRVGPVMLTGNFVRLEPLRPEHAGALFEAAEFVDWTLMLGPLGTREAVDARIESGMRGAEKDEEYPFAVVLKEGERVVGSASYLAVVSKHRRLEIGSTWYVPEMRGTVVNPECKYLLLKHAFEDWGAVRVQLGTDVRNLHSQHAIEKLGAKFEGRLRNHGVMPDGTPRDAVLYSIISEEWPGVKAGLESRIAKLAKQNAPPGKV